MGYLRTMGAGLAGSTTKLYGNANVNQIQYGDKLQGLPPVTGRRDPYRVYKSKAGGNAPDRFRVFCVNQLGGIGMGNKNSQFAPNADGLGWCPNRKNSREGDIGINKADRGHNSKRSQSRADEKAEFDINISRGAEYCDFTAAEIRDINQGLTLLNDYFKSSGFIVVAMGRFETIRTDILNSALSSDKKQELESEHLKSVRLDTDASLPSGLKSIVKDINTIIGKSCSWVNRPNNGRDNTSLGDHELVLITPKKANILYDAGYGVIYTGMNLTFYASDPNYIWTVGTGLPEALPIEVMQKESKWTGQNEWPI